MCVLERATRGRTGPCRLCGRDRGRALGSGRAELRGAAFELSSRYRTARAKAGSAGLSHEQRRAYLATRLPATYAATAKVLSELASLRPGWVAREPPRPRGRAGDGDLGGLGGVRSHSATVCVERDPEMAELGARLLGDAPAGLLAGDDLGRRGRDAAPSCPRATS